MYAYAWNRQLIGLIVSMWIVSFLALFGMELRVFLFNGNIFLPLTVFMFYLMLTFGVKDLLLNRTAFFPSIWIDGKRHRVQLRAPHEKVSEAVREATEELGIKSDVDVRCIERTWKVADAYVFGSGDSHCIVVTGGAQALLLRGRPEETELFNVMIKHELGHIANQDTSILFLARALIWTSFVCLPLKFVLMLLVGPGELLGEISDLLPQRYEAFLSYYPPISVSLDETWVIFLFFGYTALILLPLPYFYVAIVKHREFAADTFAIDNSRDPDRAADCLERLLRSTSLKGWPAHSFKSNTRWHPKVGNRIRNAAGEEMPDTPSFFAIIVLIVTFFSYRFCFGVKTRLDIEELTTLLVPLSAAFILMFGYLIDCYVNGPISASSRGKSWSRLSRLFIWTCLVFAPTALLLFTQRPSFGLVSWEGHEELIDIEITEQALLVCSIPVVVLAFGISLNLCHRFIKDAAKTFFAHAATVFCASSLTLLMLWSISEAAAPLLKSYHERKAYRVLVINMTPESGGDVLLRALAREGLLDPQEAPPDVSVAEPQAPVSAPTPADHGVVVAPSSRPVSPPEHESLESEPAKNDDLEPAKVGTNGSPADHSTSSSKLLAELATFDGSERDLLVFLQDAKAAYREFEQEVEGPFDQDSSREMMMRMVRLEAYTLLFERFEFSPPLSFLFLWHAPFQRGWG